MVKIVYFHLRDAKGIVDVEWEPAADGITVLGGKSGQGKTCVLDLIAWVLGGDKYRPDKAKRDGATGYPDLDIRLDNGLVITRKGKKSTLKVTDADKALGNQGLLNKFIGTFALDAPKFLRLSAKDKAEALLSIIGVGDELKRLDKLHEDLYAEREAHGRVTTQKEKYAAELPLYKDVPVEETSVGEIVEQIRAVDKQNAWNAKQRHTLESIDCGIGDDKDIIAEMTERLDGDRLEQARHIAALEKQISEARSTLVTMTDENKQKIADKTNALLSRQREYNQKKDAVDQLTDEPTDALQQQLDTAEETNAKVRANAEKTSASKAASIKRNQYIALTGVIECTRAERIALLDGADLPLPGLGIEAGELTYRDMPWDSVSTSDGMKIASAISARERPECRFLLADGLETMDVDKLEEFNEWAVKEKLQIIGTRVSTGSECSLIIQEGKIAETK